jgi:hypothetical protein
MDVLDTTRAYPFDYVSKVLTNSQQYEWMGYISFPYNIVYLSSSALPINCAASFLYSQSVFYQWTQVNDYLCVFNATYNNLFVSLRQVSASQELTLFFDETKRRNLCGVCGCDVQCEQIVAIVMGVVAGVVLFVGFLLCVRTRVIKNMFSVGKRVSIKAS